MARRLYAGAATDLLSPQQVRHLFPPPITYTLQLRRGDTMYRSSPTGTSRLTNRRRCAIVAISWRRHGIITGTIMGTIGCYSGAVSVSVSYRNPQKLNGPLEHPAGFFVV